MRDLTAIDRGVASDGQLAGDAVRGGGGSKAQVATPDSGSVDEDRYSESLTMVTVASSRH